MIRHFFGSRRRFKVTSKKKNDKRGKAVLVTDMRNPIREFIRSLPLSTYKKKQATKGNSFIDNGLEQCICFRFHLLFEAALRCSQSRSAGILLEIVGSSNVYNVEHDFTHSGPSLSFPGTAVVYLSEFQPLGPRA